MYIALSLCALEYLHYLFFGNVLSVFSRLNEEFRDISETDTHMAFDVAYALASYSLSFTAGAYHRAELVVFIEPV